MIWREECHAFLSKNPGKVITHYHFGAIFGRTWRRAMTPSNITAGFKITGVYPLNRFTLLPPEDNEKQSLCERTGLNFIPFYTPRRSRKVPLQSTSTEDQSFNDTHASIIHPDVSLIDFSYCNSSYNEALPDSDMSLSDSDNSCPSMPLIALLILKTQIHLLLRK